MRTTRIQRAIFDDETTPAKDRVMRAYWLAPRMSRSATVIALQDSAPVGPTAQHHRRPSDLA